MAERVEPAQEIVDAARAAAIATFKRCVGWDDDAETETIDTIQTPEAIADEVLGVVWRELFPPMRDLWLAVDDALDDLPRYMAVVGQAREGWLPGAADAPAMETCLAVDDVRRLLRARIRDRGAGSTGGEA